ncbi:hypothetical protein KSK37_08385 [Kaistella sp. DKR-2]|uniref:hypothetical protein n=1 Tax=Kaistella soli TaxID=2849654 RepID=UPI001C26ABF1|nr:hypothetical protein [Kaistella soli]MBU8883097.1 hypothetical protein [Kaistella soli]
MKKYITAAAIVLMSGYSLAQSDSRFYNTEGSYKRGQETDPGGGGGIGGEDPQPAPIDDYVPALFIAGLAIAAYYAGKKQKVTAS